MFTDATTINKKLRLLFQREKMTWIKAQAQWPISFNLGVPTEKQAQQYLSQFKQWQKNWYQWQGGGEINWVIKQWHNLGQQRVPEKITFHHCESIISSIGQIENWQVIKTRYNHLVTEWPILEDLLHRYYEQLSAYSNIDYERLLSVINWFINHPTSNIYLRQIPIADIDTKWIEQRKNLLIDVLRKLKNCHDPSIDFYQLAGLRSEPNLIRIAIKDRQLREKVACLSDFIAVPNELNQLPINPKNVFIIENLRSGMAMPDLTDTVVIMGLGYAVDVLQQIEWLKQANCFYWGDIDTHGLAILNRVRQYIPHIKSMMMDRETLMKMRPMWGHETKPSTGKLTYLNLEEQQLYQDLQHNKLGQNIRLEQERITWSYVENFFQVAMILP